VLAAAKRTAATAGLMPRTLVLLADGEPVGTASLVAHDLDERPDLTPWLAGMFVAPHARGQGHAARLIAAVEQEAAAASISTLWLYTNTAERVYARGGA
jgi:GNAT superfamily N-acetyltransferase